MGTPIIICRNIKGGSGNTFLAIHLCNECGAQKIFSKPLIIQLSLYPDLQSYMELTKKTDILTLRDFIENENDEPEAIKCIHQKDNMFLLPSSEKTHAIPKDVQEIKKITDWLGNHFDAIFIDIDRSVPKKICKYLTEICSLQLVIENYDRISMEKTEKYLKQLTGKELKKTHQVINQYPRKINMESMLIPESEKIFSILPYSPKETIPCILYKSVMKLEKGALKKSISELAKKIQSILLKKDS